jgi:hypothetical protein
VTELVEQQTAISEVLRAIANSPHDLQPIFDVILDSSTRLCRADIGLTTFNPKKMLLFVIFFSLVKIRAQVSRGHARRPFFN